MKIQVTLFSHMGYKPISTVVNVPDMDYLLSHKQEVKNKGIVKICCKKYWQNYHLIQYGYSKVKMRVYKGGK